MIGCVSMSVGMLIVGNQTCHLFFTWKLNFQYENHSDTSDSGYTSESAQTRQNAHESSSVYGYGLLCSLSRVCAHRRIRIRMHVYMMVIFIEIYLYDR